LAKGCDESKIMFTDEVETSQIYIPGMAILEHEHHIYNSCLE